MPFLILKIMELQHFKKEVNKIIEKHPNLKEDILDFYQLAIDEIDNEGSTAHEIELCMSSIDQLIEENNGSN